MTEYRVYPDGDRPDLWEIRDEYGRRWYPYAGIGVFQSQGEAERTARRLEWESEQPVGVRTSGLLIEARAALSRVDTTLSYSGVHSRNPEDAEIRRDLAAVSDLLRKWERTGRMPKYEPPTEERE